MSVEERTAAHYGNGNLLSAIHRGLELLGKDTKNLDVEDLAPVDHYHGGGVDSTQRLAERLDRYASLKAGDHLLDVGCGLGGPARFFATAYDCRLTGVDLTAEFCDIAVALNKMTGLSERIDIRNGSATDLPFEADSFDHAYSQAISMNIEDKEKFHSEAARVLKPGGCFALTEIVQGPGGDVLFPMPYARSEKDSFVVALEDTIGSLGSAGFEILLVANTSDRNRKAHAERRDIAETGKLPALGAHLIMGEDALEMMRFSAKNHAENRIISYAYICRKR